MKVVGIIQARTGSTRLPGKVLLDLAGEPMLARAVSRVRRAKTLDDVVVATTSLPPDDAIVELCAERGWNVFRGSEDDVLDRYYRAAVAHRADAVVRITSDCPLIDPDVVDQVVTAFLERRPRVDYASNVLPVRTFPRGLDTEVFSFDALARAWREDKNPAWREHVTPYIYNNPCLFQLHCLTHEVAYSDMRWTVDTAEDLALVKLIYDYFGDGRFSWRDALRVLEQHPEWAAINRHVEQKVV